MEIPKTITIILSEDPYGGYFVEIKELNGCMSAGDTESEALQNILDAKKMWIEAMTEYEESDNG